MVQTTPEATPSIPPLPHGEVDARIGQTLCGRYAIERLIAAGGMGKVYLANQVQLSRKVAIKIVQPMKMDPEFRARFLREASTSAQLAHQHVVTVHDYGQTDEGELFMAMEFLDGTPLSRLVEREGRLNPARVCEIALQVCRGLRAAHSKGVVHRDLKPSNIMIMKMDDEEHRDFVKVLDFGLAKLLPGVGDARNNPELTGADTLLGSPRYMTPEQIRCDKIDERTDIYSLGVLMFHMLSGRPPFVGDAIQVMHAHLNQNPPTLADVGAPHAPELEVIILRCLQKQPDARYANVQELMDDLKAAQRLASEASLSDSIHDFSGPDLVGAGSHPGLRAVPPRGGSSVARPSSRITPPPSFVNAADLTPPLWVGSAREAAFNDADRTYASLSEGNAVIVAPPPKASKVPMILGGVGLLVGVTALVLVGLGRAPAPTEPEPTQHVVVQDKDDAPATGGLPEEASITFWSNPQGAEVYDGEALLGKTPFTRVFKASTDDHEFRFKLQGYAEVTAVMALDRAERTVKTTLPPAPAGKDKSAPTRIVERAAPARKVERAEAKSDHGKAESRADVKPEPKAPVEAAAVVPPPAEPTPVAAKTEPAALPPIPAPAAVTPEPTPAPVAAKAEPPPAAPAAVTPAKVEPKANPYASTSAPAPAPAEPAKVAPPKAAAKPEVAPKLISGGIPPYPEEARRRELEGDLVVKVLVGADGRVKEAEVVKGLCHSCDKAAVRWARTNWKFRAGQVDSKASEMWTTISMKYRLER